MEDYEFDWLETDVTSEAKIAESTLGKTEDEIQRFTVNESLADVDRVCLFLDPAAHPLQRRHAMETLHTALLGGSISATELDRLHTAVVAVLPNCDDKDKEAAAGSLCSALTACEGKPALLEKIPLALLPLTLLVLDKTDASKDAPVARAWLRVLELIVKSVPHSVVVSQVLPLSSRLCEGDRSPHTRSLACRIMGLTIPQLTPTEVEDLILKQAITLCQDTESEVRVAMCEQLSTFARVLPTEKRKALLVKELEELLGDEDNSVRGAAFASMVDMVDLLPPATLPSLVFPTFHKFCRSASQELLEIVINTSAKFLSKVIHGLPQDSEIFEDFATCFKEWAGGRSAPLRKVCAQNFADVVAAAGARRYVLQFHPALTILATDSSEPVRASLAGSLHKLAQVLGTERCVTYLRGVLLLFFKESSLPVYTALTQNLGEVFVSLSVANDPSKNTAVYSEMLPMVVQLQERVPALKWRVLVQVFRALTTCAEHIPSDLSHELLLPMAYNQMASGVLPVQQAAARLVVAIHRTSATQRQRHEVMQRLTRDFRNSPSFLKRSLFVDVCCHALSLCSSGLFKEAYFDHLLDMCNDPVANVRVKVCPLLPAIKRSLKLPDDAPLLSRVTKAANALASDKDKDVSSASRLVGEEFKRMAVRITGLPVKEGGDAMVAFDRLDVARAATEAALYKDQDKEDPSPGTARGAPANAGGASGSSNTNTNGPAAATSSSSASGTVLKGLTAGARPSAGPKFTGGAGAASASSTTGSGIRRVASQEPGVGPKGRVPTMGLMSPDRSKQPMLPSMTGPSPRGSVNSDSGAGGAGAKAAVPAMSAHARPTGMHAGSTTAGAGTKPAVRSAAGAQHVSVAPVAGVSSTPVVSKRVPLAGTAAGGTAASPGLATGTRARGGIR